ncbi:hypothetical protein A3C09_03065 [Candidatus Uhrbacteria bacterium RIFCSPHIGHO2_02_FULL_47_44]|uniref:Uncharacterized protein n=1 Tax=Candidatus Uhrbacteria bacterium RIFCSPLOWO2_02_FULL_48_18 TaxID=1802408 RepID=A0A1F7V7Y0_9BACT|nr:MAG: hypothetical protein A2839_01350 [Candidatus Uhrbacteria bacterium RIFCSPHIGHO2_01_FULL_47_10]OGL69729.1 MAG: hypothetical protein A3C09_03065 [Candidatus Uhrbacteria bacterium RIFCSPHIGHO2_02_FULL_47_44]OGL76908.1 MAG: hypothetical protein A3E97_04465 [Candidatus Uhrbacteria bacterium RIFCSPHIGHO2_12_FULL_47_12]OGL80338.1 MAG: hypothetical protein A3B20_02840 [Candidatus Uhrbacteria bacterium RIFCSPLOWO2_01_FULL_47_17]OGL86197.1 MAG: hypothetical protein A3I41_01330 [Candidatus Uhrbact
MRRSFYMIVGSLVVCLSAIFFAEATTTEPTLSSQTESFGHYVELDLDPNDFYVCGHPILDPSTQKGKETKNSPGSIDLDY